MEWSNGDYLLTDEKNRADVEAVSRLLATTYWAADQPRSVTECTIQHSICFSLFYQQQQVGFARAVTDQATFTWICDVVVHPAHRGKGLGKWMVQCMIAHPKLQTRSQVLATRDAHGLYEPFGFKRVEYLKRKP
jgi:GNAT superfamily N-acetyltransferase